VQALKPAAVPLAEILARRTAETGAVIPPHVQRNDQLNNSPQKGNR